VVSKWGNAPELDHPNECAVSKRSFLLPSSGLIGLLYGDPAAPYHVLRRHSGIDIFGNGTLGTVPIVAAYHGYLTREADWKSSVIIRHDDPLRVGRTIWTYYTHGGCERNNLIRACGFPAEHARGIRGAGTVIGVSGEYGGNLRIGLHLHFSIVKSDPQGAYMNETVLANTLDPSPYLGMQLQANRLPSRPINCQNT
jgi:murein DD-endopeptidase MepM/ murein hydrolase activator NlpD